MDLFDIVLQHESWQRASSALSSATNNFAFSLPLSSIHEWLLDAVRQISSLHLPNWDSHYRVVLVQWPQATTIVISNSGQYLDHVLGRSAQLSAQLDQWHYWPVHEEKFTIDKVNWVTISDGKLSSRVRTACTCFIHGGTISDRSRAAQKF